MNIQTITMIQKHIDLVAKVMNESKLIFADDPATWQWDNTVRRLCERFTQTYPSFNEAEFRKKCGEGEA